MTDENRPGLGWLPEPLHAKSSHSYDEVLGDAFAMIPRFLSLDWCVDDIRDQGTAPTCCGFGLGQALQVSARQRLATAFPGNSDKWKAFTVPSALHIYVQALCFSGRIGTDSGTSIFEGLAAVEKGGFIPEKAVPYDQSRRFEELWVDELQSAIMQKGIKYHRMTEDNPVVAKEMIQNALAIGRSIAAGVHMDQAGFDNQGEIWPGPTGPSLGGHCMCLLDYPDGMPRFVNSWGRFRCRNGYLHTTWDVVCESESLWIIDFAPNYQLG